MHEIIGLSTNLTELKTIFLHDFDYDFIAVVICREKMKGERLDDDERSAHDHGRSIF